MVKRKRGIYEFDPVVYPFLLWVTISDDFDKALTGYECMDDSMLPDVKPDAGVFRVIRESDRRWGVMVVYNRARSITYGTAAHEAMHVLVQVYDVIGADITFKIGVVRPGGMDHDALWRNGSACFVAGVVG